MRALAVVTFLLLAGCTDSREAPGDPEEVALDEADPSPTQYLIKSAVTNTGDLPGWYTLRVHEYDEQARRPGQQVAQHAGDLLPGEVDRYEDTISWSDHWVTIDFKVGPMQPFAMPPISFGAHVDPSRCDAEAYTFDATVDNGVDGWGGGYSGDC